MVEGFRSVIQSGINARGKKAWSWIDVGLIGLGDVLVEKSILGEKNKYVLMLDFRTSVLAQCFRSS